MTNFVLSDRHVPTHMLKEDIKYSLYSQILGKVPTSKAMVHLFSVKALGEIKKNF